MAKFLIDVNLPYRFKLWQHPDYIHSIWDEVLELNETHKLINIFINRIEGIKLIRKQSLGL